MSDNQIIIYQDANGLTKLQVEIGEDSVWLSQEQMAELFNKSRSTITEHIKNIFIEEELDEQVVCRNFRHTTQHGAMTEKMQISTIKKYNLDVIISVGYRVKSVQGTRFRQWATQRLREYLIKGFTMDDDKLKSSGGGDYWAELLNRIKDIRSNEKVFYRQVLDLFQTSMDYDAKSETCQKFFAIVQNKLHYAVHGHTAAELIYERADAVKDFMGMLSINNKKIHKSDVAIAKNYLNETELKKLNNMVSAYFDIAELRAIDQRPTNMKDYINLLDRLIISMEGDLLQDAGKISKIEAEFKAHSEYTKYQLRNPSPVETAYLETIKSLHKTAKIANKA